MEQKRSLTGNLESGIVATICGLISAVGYTAANISLRSVVHVDAVWVSCIKAVPTFLGVLPFLIFRKNGASPLFPTKKVFWVILIVGLIGHIFGNILFQWALGIIGLALNVPITLGTLIALGAVLGPRLLNDKISGRMILCGVILIVAIGILSFGAHEAQQSVTRASLSKTVPSQPVASLSLTIAGLTASCLCGMAYCTMSFGVRYATRIGAPKSSVLGLVSLVGIVGLGAITFLRSGIDPVLTTSAEDYLQMFLAGIFNFIAFVALAQALQVASVFFVNALNASQIGMAAVAGVFLFQEPVTHPLLIGIGLTIIGLLFMREPDRKRSRKSIPSKFES